MRSARRSLEIRNGLAWVEVSLVSAEGSLHHERFVLDTGTSHTSLAIELATELGFPRSKRRGIARFETPHGVVRGYTVRLPSVSVMGRSVSDLLVGCQRFQTSFHVPGILGLDFFDNSDLLLSLRKTKSIHLAW